MLDHQTRLDLIAELGQVIRLLAQGKAEADDEALRSLGAITKDRAQQTLPGLAPVVADVDPAAARRQAVLELFAYWQRECNHGQAKLTPERATCIGARLRDGYTTADIRKAIDGAKHGAFEEGGKRFDDITLICRNGSKLEDFIQRGVKATGAIVIAAPSVGGVEEQIAALRREMAALHKAGRTTEYNDAAAKLKALLAKRGGAA